MFNAAKNFAKVLAEIKGEDFNETRYEIISAMQYFVLVSAALLISYLFNNQIN